MSRPGPWMVGLCTILLVGFSSAVFAQSNSSAPRARPAGSPTLRNKPVPPPDTAPTADTRSLRSGQRLPPPTEPTEPSDPTESDPGTTTVPPAAAATPANATPTPAPASRAPRELLLVADGREQADEQRAWLAERGVTILRRRLLPNLGSHLSIYSVSPETDLPALLTEIAATWPDSMPESNQHYAIMASGTPPPSGARLYAQQMIAWPAQSRGRRPRIAMLDGPVNTTLAAFAGRRVQIHDVTEPRGEPDFDHGTALAALLLGAPDSPGLLPDAELLVGVVTRKTGKHTFATTESLLRGLDWVLGLSPSPAALNLSFGGPHSAQLQRAIARVVARTHVIAAAGNDGRSLPIYPAAYAGVIAVGAVDARARHWPRANTGAHLAVVAPGVDLWTLDGAGQGYYATGTSFAAVYVTAALAISNEQTDVPQAWLRAHTRDLGPASRDPRYGYGLLCFEPASASLRQSNDAPH